MTTTSKPTRLRMGRGGRLVIPASVRRRLHLEPGTDVLLTETPGGNVEITSAQAAWRRAQEEVRKHIPPGVSLVDELLAERRQEAERE